MTGAIQVVTTVASREEAQRIARALVERRLAACVQVSGPVTSTYRWRGQIETGEEFLCIVKTQKTAYAAVEAAFRELHSYELPEILALPIIAGSQAYLDWLSGEVEGEAEG